MLLRLIGSSPVNSTDTDHPDAANALATMERVSKRVQRRGWWCNNEYDIILAPDENGLIEVGSAVSTLVTENRNYVLRNNRLYDNKLQTAIFTDNVRVKRLVRVLEWDDMPAILQEATAYTAAAEFVRDELEDPQKEQSLKEDASRSYLDLKKQDLEEGQYNIFSTPRILRARGGVAPYARNSMRFFGDPDR